MSRIKLAVIGCGGMSLWHLKGFKDLDDRLEIAALVDIDYDHAARGKEIFPDAIICSDYHDILDKVDAALLSLPHHLHHAIGMDCLNAGLHVLMEKPLANTEAECLELIETAEKLERVLMVGYVMRYDALTCEMKRLLDAETYGQVFHVSLWTEQLTIVGEQRMPWAADHRKLGGGQLFSHGCHYIDLLLWFLGEPVEGTHIGTKLGTPWMDWEGTSDASLRFEGGKIGYHMGTWGARGTRLGASFHAHCTEGMLEADIRKGTLIIHRNLKPHNPDEVETQAEELLMTAKHGKNTGTQMAHFIDCINTGEIPRTSARDSLQSLRIIWRLYEAEREHRVADLRGLGLLHHR